MKKIIFIILILSSLILGCSSPSPEEILREQAAQVASDFFALLQSGNYDIAYDYLTPELQAQRNRSDFIEFAEAHQLYHYYNYKLMKIDLQDENTAYAHYSVNPASASLNQVEMSYISQQWKIAMKELAASSCVVKDCEKTEIPKLTNTFIKRCLDTGHNYDECKYLAERDYGDVKFKCDKSTAYKCAVIE